MSNRKAATEFILSHIDKILPGSPNCKRYEDLFAGMNDKQFDELLSSVRDMGRHMRGEAVAGVRVQ